MRPIPSRLSHSVTNCPRLIPHAACKRAEQRTDRVSQKLIRIYQLYSWTMGKYVQVVPPNKKTWLMMEMHGKKPCTLIKRIPNSLCGNKSEV
ncbi:fibroblast growth factor 8 isoform X2 [Lates japonicus]|uniref:Fibroblast growth factor 8 isoform X2 n=1 Tax=Lates japonicus TaxID=270547 RepID=A0AAD3N0E4_LATJO|nr:fibroblast growth factor 8 isoform X2 [Lates japonicus]